LLELSQGAAESVLKRALRDEIGRLRAAGFVVLALSPRPDARSLRDRLRLEAIRRYAVVVGAEGPGLSAEALANAGDIVRIPMAAGTDSLNVSVATGVALYELWMHNEQRRHGIG
jgi:tRNA G18 (ribose-2'-O)-methylase SpoU